MSVRPNSSRDKRVSKLTKESAKLRQEITELEDALVLHSRFQVEDETSIQGIIRREVGGARWEHGGEGKLHTYRGNRDLDDKLGHDKRKRAEKSSTSRSHMKDTESHRTASSSAKESIPQDGVLSKCKSDGKTVDKTCLNGEWALKSERKAKKTNNNSDKGGGSEFGALKNKVLAKASAKVIKRKDFAPTPELKSNRLQGVSNSSNENYVRNNHSRKSKDIKEDNSNGKNKQNNDISYSLSFLDNLHETETRESILPQTSSIAADDRKSQEQQRDISKLLDEVEEGNDAIILKDNIISCVDENVDSSNNLKDSKRYKWAKERDKASKDVTQQDRPRSLRRNSVGGTCHQNGEENSKAKSRMSQPLCETDRHIGNRKEALENRQVDFPLLFGGSVHVSLSDGSSGQKHTPEDGDDDSPLIGSSPGTFVKSTKKSIIICDEEVQSWIENLGLQDVDNYVILFADHEMDMSSIKLLTASRLREMGIHALGPIMKIIKGVQVLNRDSLLREDVCEEDTVVDQVKRSISEISHSDEPFGKDGMVYEGKNEADTAAIPLDENVKETPQNQTSSKVCPSSLSWKKTTDEAEYVNLNDRSPVDDIEIPPAVSVKQKTKKLEKEKKSTAPSKSGQRKTKPSIKVEGHAKDEIRPSSKVVKKPPVKAKDGITSAQEKILERKKQEEFRTQSDQVTSARQRQLRDKMAARHTSRRSSSLERRVSSSRSQRDSLNRTLSESQDEVTSTPGKLQKMEDLLKTKPLGIGEHSRESSTSDNRDNGNMEEEDALMELLDTQNLDQAVEKLADSASASTKESLNLSIVRQLKQQLQHIERHLVQKMEQPDGGDMTERSQEEIAQHKKNMNRDSNVRTSARERRRQRTPNQFSSTLEGNSDIAKEFFKVGSIMSHRKMKDDESPDEEKEDAVGASNNIQNENECLASPKIETSKVGNVEHETSQQATDNNSRIGWVESNRPTMNTEAPILDNVHANKLPRQTELSRGKLAMAQEYLRKIEIDKKDISFETKDLLGDGAFSQVYKGIYQGSEVAIKQLKTSLTSNDKNYFSAEVSLLQDLRHPHVVMLLGVCTAYTCPVLVLEYMEGGNLYTRVHDADLPLFSKEEFCQISKDIASGICYLHNHRPPVLHLDLKSRNVLLGLGNRAKVADFGFSKWKVESDIRVSRSSKAKLSQGSPAWMAPELMSAGDITPKADVYSFAIVLWEMLAREDPYTGCSTFQILERVRTCQRPPIPSECLTNLKTLMESGWEQNPCTRPTFKEILQDLDKISSCEEWMLSLQEPTGEIEQNQSSQSSLPVDEISATEDKTNSQFDSGNPVQIDLRTSDYTQFKGHDNLIEIEESSKNEGSFDCQVDEESTEIMHGKNSENFKENDTKISIHLPDSATNSSQRTSTASLHEDEMFGSSKPVELGHMEIEIQMQNKTKQSSEGSGTSPRVKSQHDSGKSSTAQMLLASSRDTKKLDELLHKYLPSPRQRDNVRKDRPVSSSGDASTSRKLLPLRQSLDKPKKPPKPGTSSNVPMSQSENFALCNDGDVSVSEKVLEEMKAIAKLSLNKDPIPSNDSVENSTVKSTTDLETSQDASLDQTNEHISSRSRMSVSPREKKSQQDEGSDISLHDLSIPIEEPHLTSRDSPDLDVVNKTTEASWSSSSPFKSFSDVTKEIEQTLSRISMPLSPSSSSLHPNQMNARTSIQGNEQVSETNGSSSFRDEKRRPDSSRSMASDSIITKRNSNEYVASRSSISTDMSVDSLSLSLSDEADSIDFSTNDSRHLSHKKGKSKVKKAQPLLPVNKTDRNLGFSSAGKNNSDTQTKSNGTVRESFFLFNDFHLDLNQLSDNNSDSEDTTHTIPPPKTLLTKKTKSRHPHTKDFKSHPPTLSPTVKQQREKHSQLYDSHQHQSKSKEAGISTQSSSDAHSSYTKMNPMLKESIHLSKQRKDTHASTHIIPPPPPPPLSLTLLSHQIKRNTNHSNPLKSGVPIKSASSKPEVQGHSRFSVEPGLLLQQRNRLKTVLPPELSPLNEPSHGRSMPSVASILKKAMDERRFAMGDNHESQEVLTTPEASWSLQD